MKPIAKSSKLANVCYDIRGPVLDKARQMQDEGHKIIQLNIGNIAAFGLEPPDEIVQDMIRNLPHTAGYTDSKGLFAPRRAVVHYTQEKQLRGVTVDARSRSWPSAMISRHSSADSTLPSTASAGCATRNATTISRSNVRITGPAGRRGVS